jgi:hypothetical protein
VPATVDIAVESNVPLSEIIERGNKKDPVTKEIISDGAIENHVAEEFKKAMASASLATTKAGLDTAIKPVAIYAPQLEDAGITSEAQIKIIAEVGNGGGATSISKTWDIADRNQRRAYEKLVKIAAARAEEITRKGGAGGDANKQAVLDFIENLKKEMPRNREKDPVTNKDKVAPPTIREYLYGT